MNAHGIISSVVTKVGKHSWNGSTLYHLRREPDNMHDSNAVSVRCVAAHGGPPGVVVGWLSSGTAAMIAPTLDAGITMVARYTGQTHWGDSCIRIRVQ